MYSDSFSTPDAFVGKVWLGGIFTASMNLHEMNDT